MHPCDAVIYGNLDVQVHREVMGIDLYASPFVVINKRRIDILTYLPTTHTPEDPPAGWCAEWRPPHYSTDIGAAFQVVEHLQERWEEYGTIECNSWAFDRMSFRRWRAAIHYTDLSGVHQVVCEQADTLPLAICRAALAWVRLNSQGTDD